MSLQNFVPTFWSARLLEHLDKALVFKSLVNTDYEGVIRTAGDSVKINQIGDINIVDYVKNTNMSDPQEVTAAQQTLVIDQQKAFNFQIDDIDKAQTNTTLIDKAMARAAYGIANKIDAFIASFHADAGTKIDTEHVVGNASTGEKDPYDTIVDLGVAMDEKNVGRAGRWIVVPPWFHGMLLKNEAYKSAWQNYRAGEIDTIPVVNGFSVLVSNNLVAKSGNNTWVMAGTKEAISYAGQVANVEPYRMEKRFADAVKGLYVYGTKVIQPASLIRLNAKKGA